MKTEQEVRNEIKRLRRALSKKPCVENTIKNGGISELQWVLGDWSA
jgi:hypothetical protein